MIRFRDERRSIWKLTLASTVLCHPRQLCAPLSLEKKCVFSRHWRWLCLSVFSFVRLEYIECLCKFHMTIIGISGWSHKMHTLWLPLHWHSNTGSHRAWTNIRSGLQRGKRWLVNTLSSQRTREPHTALSYSQDSNQKKSVKKKYSFKK